MAGLGSVANITELRPANVCFALMYLKREVLVPSEESANWFTLINCSFYFVPKTHIKRAYILLRAVHLNEVGTLNTLDWSTYLFTSV